MPAVQLAAIRDAAQQEQQRFCDEWRAGVRTPRGLPEDSTYDRVDSVSLGLNGVNRQNVPYWVLNRTDIVSVSIKGGAWEPEDTHAVLNQLRWFQQARRGGWREACVRTLVPHVPDGCGVQSSERNCCSDPRGVAVADVCNPLLPPQNRSMAVADAVFLDIGANLGWFALNAASLGYSVLAFEPVNVR